MSTPQTPSSAITTPVWIRWMPFWHGLFYLSLLAATGIDLLNGSYSWEHTGAVLGLSLALGMWYAVCVIVSPLYWFSRPLLTMGYLVIGWALWFGLTDLNGAYLFVLTGLYPQVFILPPLIEKLLGAFLLTLLSAWQQVMLVGGIDGNVFLTLALAVAGIIMALFIHTLVSQSQQRQMLISELETTRAALAAAERQAGIMEERQRLAHEIHDTFAQGFTSIVMHLEAAEAALPADLKTLERHLDQARQTARENLREARRVLWALQPAALDHTSLSEALPQLAARWTEESGIEALATITGTVKPLRPEVEVTLLRAAQEALANVRKHARASQVVLTLSYLDDLIALDVQDNGVGFDVSSLPLAANGQLAGGFGLKALRARVEQLGGTLTIESTPAEGTTLAVSLSVARQHSPLTLAAREVR